MVIVDITAQQREYTPHTGCAALITGRTVFQMIRHFDMILCHDQLIDFFFLF